MRRNPLRWAWTATTKPTRGRNQQQRDGAALAGEKRSGNRECREHSIADNGPRTC